MTAQSQAQEQARMGGGDGGAPVAVEIARLGHHGDGIARGEDGALYVALALPGERVEGRPEGGRIAAPRILSPSPHRVTPPCPRFAACGGCALQHGSDAFVAGWKLEVVRAALAAQGIEAPLGEIATSPANSRRRALVSARRTKKGVIAGFHGRRAETVIAPEGCTLLAPELLAALPGVEALALSGLSRKGELKVLLTASRDGIDAAAQGGKPLEPPLRLRLAQIARDAGWARLVWNGEPVMMLRPPRQRLGRAEVVPPPGAFLQATAHGEAALVAAVRAAIGGAGRVVDLFAGCGTFALPLAEEAMVHAVEGDGAMLRALDAGWRHAEGLRAVTTEARDLFRRPLLAEELARFDAAVIDPPRAGAEAQTRELARSGVKRIVAVSCNPVTFARDARLLIEGGYAPGPVRVVDQFRWSPHVELVAGFTKP